MTFHGSWDRTNPSGYVLSSIPFNNTTGEPIPAPDSTHATVDILSNADLSRCPDGCFRPVGLAWDGQGRLFMSSDSTGEVYVLQPVDFSVSGGGGGGGATEDWTETVTGTMTRTTNGTGTGTGMLVTTLSTSTWTSGPAPSLAQRSSRNRPGGETVWLTCWSFVLSVLYGVVFTHVW